MRTQLGTYCQQFDGTLRPVLQDLDLAIKALASASDETPSKSLHVPLLELQHQLRTLCDKVAEQQAYVLIFGPLKSGKSTLMNAIAASYVSEVSSLPAYPCLVFVRSGKKREYVVKLYDGSTRTFTEAAQLHEDIAQLGLVVVRAWPRPRPLGGETLGLARSRQRGPTGGGRGPLR